MCPPCKMKINFRDVKMGKKKVHHRCDKIPPLHLLKKLFIKKNPFVYLAVSGISCSTWTFVGSCGPGCCTPSLAVVRRHYSCDARAWLPCGTWTLPRPGIEPTMRILNY